MLISTKQARSSLHLGNRNLEGIVLPGVLLHGKRKEIFSCGGLGREVTWQVQGIGRFVKIVEGARILTEVLHKWSYRILIEILHKWLQDPDAEILRQRSQTRDPHTEPCTSGPRGS